MAYYVLRQISPVDTSALADEATAVALASAALRGELKQGPYLAWFDPDAKGGMGDDRWTHKLLRARRFTSFEEAMKCWKTQSKVRPLRDDGKPNRPLTAYSVEPVRIE